MSQLNSTSPSPSPSPAPTPPKTDNPEPTISTQERQALTLGIMQLLIDTNSLIETLENVILEIRNGRMPREKIADNVMPLCMFLGTLQDEHPRLEKLNENVGDAWVTHMLEEVETALIGMGQDCKKLLLPEETNGGDEGSAEDEDTRGERHFQLALQQLGSFDFDCIYGA
ncbi:uncharacterized protein H6S33_006501 [Morchella sextelata]|uniref:uncharacterized protein n=1 Tax=Morchella sextelata TaxID=1174677 RepID=UPI001D049D95|nr:uncharacterized protein H6S33_006501 [Morchella sextelata]KAH0604833.1 hypothetical protein H6S33_006501 [Morchella sextelata]